MRSAILVGVLLVAMSVGTIDISLSKSGATANRQQRSASSPRPNVALDLAIDGIRLSTVVSGLERPWAMAFLPGGDILVTERGGRLSRVRRNALSSVTEVRTVSGMPAVVATGQGGLLDVVVHGQFIDNRYVFVSWSAPKRGGESALTVARGELVADTLVNLRTLFEAKTEAANGLHFGARLLADGQHLFIAIGDRAVPPVAGELRRHPSQKLNRHEGKIVRLYDTGLVPADNPFVEQFDAMQELWTYGHRNPQGLFRDRATGMWSVEHGPKGGDELNIIEAGQNYGWPVAGYGMAYSGPGVDRPIHAAVHQANMTSPLFYWNPSVGPSSVIVYRGDMFPRWQGNVFVSTLIAQSLIRLEIRERSVIAYEVVANGLGRVRQVVEGPEGALYLLCEESREQAGRILRVDRVRPQTADR